MSPATTTPNGDRPPVIIDTDVAVDDWMAILYLLSSPLVQVRAITVAATGEAHAGPGVRTVLGLLALVGVRGIPVAAGRTRPLEGAASFPLLVRLAMDARLGLGLPPPLEPASRAGALSVLAETLQQAHQPVTIVALGPLTNIAELISARPELLRKIGSIVIMGGALAAPGNIPTLNPRIDNPFAEWNLYIDPRAADLVIASGAPITLIPLDTTNKVPLTADFMLRCAAAQQTPAAGFVYRTLRRLKRLIGARAYYFWDPLAAVVVTHPQIVRTTVYALRIVTDAGTQYGRTVERPDGARVRVCVDVDAAQFEATFLETLNAQEPELLERAVGA
jgi:pyrimidine-specific ribonucleoside hydrolase